MKVSELIEVLEQHNKDAEVTFVASKPQDVEAFHLDFVSSGKENDENRVVLWPKCDLWPKYKNRMQQQVYEFMKAVGLPMPHENDPGFERLTQKDFDRLINLVNEEVNDEFIENMYHLKCLCSIDGYATDEQKFEVWVQIIDAICDTIVVVFNSMNSMGLDIKPFFNEVQRTNMAKLNGPIRESDGKRLKPPGWKPPNISGILKRIVNKESF